MTTLQKDEFITDVLACFSKSEYTVNGAPVEGASISDLKNSLSSNLRGSHHTDRRWSGLGNLAIFERVLCEEGFTVEEGRNRRNQRVRVVYLG